MKILIIDNYDSFVHNLARYVREAGGETIIKRNDQTSVDECLALGADGVILSPGPKAPKQAGICLDLVKAWPTRRALLGVCLGHQALVEAFGGRTVRAVDPLHGEASKVRHAANGIFEGIVSPMLAGRYHSLIAQPSRDAPLIENAWTLSGALMGVVHRERPWFGVQFHPESVLTPEGRKLVGNFLGFCAMKTS